MTYDKQIKEIIESIDVPDSEYERAVNRYNSITDYISNSSLSAYDPDVFIQGSFKLGTAIKPMTEDGSYDIDIVCNLQKLSKNSLSQARLKKLLGDVLISYARSNGMASLPEDGKRCWTMNYVDNHNFHFDILPSIPNNNGSEIAITDKRNSYYNQVSNNWEISNPKDYFEWFNSISKYEVHKRKYLQESFSSEDVPYYKVKTPLQRVIQILKRHAEICFEDKMEYKPSSIIITTLSAKSFDRLPDYSTLLDLIKAIIPMLTKSVDYQNGKPCVLNPVDVRENLSVKWSQDDKYYDEFLAWIEKLKFDFSIDSNRSLNEQYLLIKRSITKTSGTIQLKQSLDLLPYHQKPKWYEVLNLDVKIKATAYQNGFLPKKLTSGQPVNKNVNLKFEVIANDVKNYEIYWQVTNTGNEAQRANQLRGDFYNSHIEEGKKIRKESTSYYGKHYVEAYLVKNGICYGKSEPFIVNIEKGAYIL